MLNIDRAVIEINGGCNYKCQMCPQTTGRGKDWLKKMPLSEFERLLDETQPRLVNLDGSGEATLNRNLPEYIDACTRRGIESYIFSNGFNMKGDFMKSCVDAGLTYYRFSVIGYDEITYIKWMARDAFATIRQHAYDMIQYGGDTTVASYHLILDNDRTDFEVEQYRKNFIEPSGTQAEIWKMHNWSGVYSPEYEREGKIRTCGRPFSPDLVIRANGKVHPCCQVLGNDDAAILGDVKENTVEEIFYGEKYEALREAHRTGDYPDYCKGCDFLIEDSEALVWTNADRSIDKMVGTEFNLQDYKSLL